MGPYFKFLCTHFKQRSGKTAQWIKCSICKQGNLTPRHHGTWHWWIEAGCPRGSMASPTHQRVPCLVIEILSQKLRGVGQDRERSTPAHLLLTSDLHIHICGHVGSPMFTHIFIINFTCIHFIESLMLNVTG